MVCSLDGFIARDDGDVSWMQVETAYPPGITLTEEEITSFLQSVDCYVMGARTYEHALELGWPYGDTPVYVLTHRPLTSERPSVNFKEVDLSQWVNDYLRPRYKNCWMVGGAQLTTDFIRLRLADELVITKVPILLGGGIPFFLPQDNAYLLHLKDVKAYQDGMVELTYTFHSQ